MIDYEKMPERIKNSRNALDHGNRDMVLNSNAHWDGELLRAIVYMMILKEAGVDEEKIRHSLNKFTRTIIKQENYI